MKHAARPGRCGRWRPVRVVGAVDGEGVLGRSRSWSFCREAVSPGQRRCSPCLTAELLNPDARARAEFARDTTLTPQVLRLLAEDPDWQVALTAQEALARIPRHLVTAAAPAAPTDPEEW